MHKPLFIVVLCPLGCAPPSICEDVHDVVVVVDQNPITVVPGAALSLTGTLRSDARIDQLSVGDTAATGTSDNYATWKVEIPATRFQGLQGLWQLETTASLCDGETIVTERSVVISIPDLVVSLEGETDACYIGANGVGAASVSLAADPMFAGTKISLGAPEGIQVLPGPTVFLSDTGGDDSRSIVSTGKLDAVVTVTATAGTQSFSSNPLVVAGPPSFDAEPKTIPNGLSVPLFVRTRGRLASCVADLPGGSSAILKLGETEAGLSATETPIELPDCGQTLLLRVSFDAGTPAGTSMVLSCEDTHGQATNRVVTSSGTP